MQRFLDKFLPFYSPPGEEGGAGGSSGTSATSSPSPSPPAGDSGSAPPSPTPSSTPDKTPASDFSGMGFDDDDVEEIPAGLPDVQPAPKEGTGAPAAAPAPKEPVKAAPTDPAQVAPPVPQPPPASEGQQGTQPASSTPAEPQSLSDQLDQHREAMIGQIAQDMFAISKEEAAQLELDVVGNLPKLGAKVYFAAVKATLNHINNFEQRIPAIIDEHMKRIEARMETEKAFYGKFSALDKTKHHPDVVAFAQAFRGANPKITQDELWAMAASAAMAKHGLSATAAPQGANGGTPPAPRPPASQPFVPAAPGVTVKTTPEPANPYSGMGKDYEEDE